MQHARLTGTQLVGLHAPQRQMTSCAVVQQRCEGCVQHAARDMCSVRDMCMGMRLTMAWVAAYTICLNNHQFPSLPKPQPCHVHLIDEHRLGLAYTGHVCG